MDGTCLTLTWLRSFILATILVVALLQLAVLFLSSAQLFKQLNVTDLICLRTIVSTHLLYLSAMSLSIIKSFNVQNLAPLIRPIPLSRMDQIPDASIQMLV